jgi:hypothetical protein
MLRDLFGEEVDAGAAKAQRTIEFVLKTGLEPFQAPDPLPPIDEEEIRLIGWVALEAQE